MQNNTIHQLTFLVKQNKEVINPELETAFNFGFNEDKFSADNVF